MTRRPKARCNEHVKSGRFHASCGQRPLIPDRSNSVRSINCGVNLDGERVQFTFRISSRSDDFGHKALLFKIFVHQHLYENFIFYDQYPPGVGGSVKNISKCSD